MTTLTSTQSSVLISIPKGSSLVVRNRSGVETVTGSSVAREDATAVLGSGAFVYGPQSATSQVAISTTGTCDYDVVVGDPTPAGGPALVTRSASTGAPSGLIDPATGQPLGGGGDPTLRRQLANKLRNQTHRRYINDAGGFELFRLPPTYAIGAVVQDQAFLSADGLTIWLVDVGGNSTAEPARDVNYPDRQVRDAGGTVVWSPFTAANYPVTKKEILRNAAGQIAQPVVACVGAGQAAPSDANAIVLTERYNIRRAVGYLSPTTYIAYQNSNHPKIDSPAAWNANDYGDSGGYMASVDVTGGVVSGIMADVAPCFRFFTKAKSVSITIPQRSGAVLNETTVAGGNIFVNGTALDPFAARGAQVTNTAFQHQYTWTFADELEREYVIFGDGAWPQAIYTSANQDIYAEPRSVVRALYASDSTGAGAAPGPRGFFGGQWGLIAHHYLGAFGLTNIANGGIGYLSKPLSPKTLSATGKLLNALDKLEVNKQFWDISLNGGVKIDYAILDQVGWDVDTTPVTYASENGAYTFSDGGGAETWKITSVERKVGFRAFLTKLLAFQPNIIIVAVTPRTNVQPGTISARGYWNVDAKGTRDSEISLFEPLAQDWLDALEEVVPAGQLCVISLAGFAENLSNHTAQTYLSTVLNDGVHPTTLYHIRKGVYVGQQILRWLGLS